MPFQMKRAIIVAAVFLTGCQYNPFAHEFTTRRPAEQSLVGRYAPDEETRERLRSHLKLEVSPDCKVFLNSDQTFVARDVPRCWIVASSGSGCHRGTEDWKGTWELAQHQEWWAVRLHITLRDDEPTSFGLPAMLRGEAPPYLVHLHDRRP